MYWTVALVLIVLAGINAPLAMCALSLAAINGLLPLRPELAFIGTPWFAVASLGLLAAQLLADLYFVPITVMDRAYISPQRTDYNFLHARAQSLLRPLTAALLLAALPLPIPDWTAAVLGFSGATGIYWLTAWVREYIALTRGALVLLIVETGKNALLLPLALLAVWLPLLALAPMLLLLLSFALWTQRLEREHRLHLREGGPRAGQDT
jgi:hypothetical protein